MNILDLVRLLRIPGAGGVFLRRYLDALWPLLYAFAALYRRTLLRRTRIVAVVGSLGKTTTTRALRTVLAPGQRVASYSNYGSSLAANLLSSRPGDSWCVLECGIDRAGWMSRYARMLQPNVVVVTSIGSEHLRSFGTLESTREEKANMVRALGRDGLAVLNGDDPNVMWMASQTRARVVTFGMNESNDVRATGVELDWPHGTRFTVSVAGEGRSMRSPLIGEHQVYAVLAAIAVGIEAGLTWDNLVGGIQRVSPAPGRMEVTRLPNGALILDDSCKGTLESLHMSLEVLSRIPAERRVAVLSDIDEVPGRTGDVYRALGATLSGVADAVIFVGSQKFGKLKTGATRAGMHPTALTYVGSRLQAVPAALAGVLTPGTVILLKGAQRRRLTRVKLMLLNRAIRCQARECTAKVASCEVCPLLAGDGSMFENAFVRRYVC